MVHGDRAFPRALLYVSYGSRAALFFYFHMHFGPKQDFISYKA